MTPLILAVDLGSTAFKAAIFGPALERLGSGAAMLEYRFGSGGRVELEASTVVAAVGGAVREALDQAGLTSPQITALALTSQAQTFTVLDQRGTARMPFISWQDGRAEAGRLALETEPGWREFAQHSSFATLLKEQQVAQLRHLQQSQPGWLKSSDRIVSLPEYVVWKLTGDFVLDDNLAAMSGLYSLIDHRWWEPALEACEVQPAQLARVVPLGTTAAVTGSGALEWGLPAGIPVVLAGNDQTAGAYGAAVHNGATVLLTIGTAQVAYTCTAPQTTLPAPTTVIHGPYPGARTYRMVADSVGGNLVNWGERCLAGCETDDTFFHHAALAPPACDGLRFNADFGATAGGWEGLALHHRSSHLARSILEALNERMKTMVEQLGLDPTGIEILVAGGGSAQPVWVDMLAITLGQHLRRVTADPLRGAAAMALQG